MTGVLVALATVTVVVGLLGAPQLGAVFGEWVFFQELEEALFVPWIAAASTLAGARSGSPSATGSTTAIESRDPLRSLGRAYTLVANKYYIDDIYWKGIVRPVRDDLSAASTGTTGTIIDGVVNGAAAFTKTLGNGVNWFDQKVIDGAVNGLANLAGFTGGLLRYIQSGNVQRYAVFLFAGVVVLAVIFTKI